MINVLRILFLSATCFALSGCYYFSEVEGQREDILIFMIIGSAVIGGFAGFIAIFSDNEQSVMVAVGFIVLALLLYG